MRPLNRKLSAATFATALAFAGVACDNDGEDVGEEIDGVEDELDSEVDGEGE